MKTTVELPDELTIRAKKRAAEERTTLKALIEQSLRAWLDRGDQSGPRKRIRWVVAEGGVPAEIDDRSAMYDWLDRA